jgi:hypothetical protein
LQLLASGPTLTGGTHSPCWPRSGGLAVAPKQVERLTEPIGRAGGGFLSALAADNLQKMGYTNVFSMDGGIGGWRAKGYPLTRG